MFRLRAPMALLFLVSLAATADQKAIPGLGETIEVSIVNVDVFVTDRAGNRVRGLTRDDFDIFENGVKQPITNFAEYSEEAGGAEDSGRLKPAAPPVQPAAPPVQPAAPPPPQQRTIILFFERFYLPKFHNDPMFASLKNLLHEAVRPGDRASIVTWNRGVMLTHQAFTDSLPALDRSIDRIAQLSSRPMLDVTAETQWSVADIRAFEAEVAASAGGALPDVGDSLASLELQSAAQRDVDDMQRKIKAINALMRSIAGTEGKKILLLATHRLSLEAGAEHYYRTGSRSIPGEKRQELDMREQIKSIWQTANANNVTIYPVYPEGLQAYGTSDANYLINNNETPALRQIADATGGSTAWGADDVTKLLPRVEEDLQSYYSLAYRVQSSGSDRARSIVVKTKDKAFRVRSRREYNEKSDVTKMEDRVIAALFRNPPSPGFALHVAVGKRRTRGNGSVIPIKIDIPISVLTALPAGDQYNGAFSVYFAWGGLLGGISDTSHDTKTYRIPARDIEKARASHYTYQFDLAVDQRTDRVALGVLDEVSREYALRLIELKR